jgi:hypothetical protein
MSSLPVRALTYRAEIGTLFERNRIRSAYALGDLDDGMFELCEWYTDADALTSVFKGLSFFPVFTQGRTEGIEGSAERT